MSEARLEITLGSTKFLAEGSESWLSAELDKFLAELPQIAVLDISRPNLNHEAPGSEAIAEQPSLTNLPKYLQETASTTSQVRKFLATAIWLQEKHGKSELKTTDVAKALRDSMQSRIGNPSDVLNQNVGKGYCEKTATGFFVTSEGRASISSKS